MRQFNYFANGGPFPGTCLSCGNNKDLYDLGKDEQTKSSHLLCTRCIGELAATTGHILRAPAIKEHDHLKAHIAELEAIVVSVPNQIEGLINGIRSNVADFVLAISSGDDLDSNSSIQDDAKPSAKPVRNRKAEDSND